jgi:ribosomal protein S18 acetylase RimI-like enzyme
MATTTEIEISEADLTDTRQVSQLVDILDAYAREPAGGSAPIPAEVREKLLTGLQHVANAIVLLAKRHNQAVGAAVCFLGYSTFAARPILNIHDLAVLPQHRGNGIGHALLAAVDRRARTENCCKVTLEVLETNRGARRLYADVGYGKGGPGAADTTTRFLQKRL